MKKSIPGIQVAACRPPTGSRVCVEKNDPQISSLDRKIIIKKESCGMRKEEKTLERAEIRKVTDSVIPLV